MKINPCRCCGRVPEPYWDNQYSGYWEISCEVYACNNPDIAMGTTEEHAIYMWNELNPVKEDENAAG